MEDNNLGKGEKWFQIARCREPHWGRSEDIILEITYYKCYVILNVLFDKDNSTCFIE